MPTHEVAYFPFPGARGEAIRIAMYAAKVDFENKGVPFPEYGKLKSETKDCAWKNGLPVLSVDGTAYTQSIAQLRYAGKLAKLYPEDPVAALRVDEVMDICQDALTKCPQDSDKDVKKAKREEYSAPNGKLTALMSLLAQRAEANKGGYIAGPDLTIADLCLHFYLLTMLRTGDFDYVPNTYTDQWPALAELEKKIPEHPVFKDNYDKGGFGKK